MWWCLKPRPTLSAGELEPSEQMDPGLVLGIVAGPVSETAFHFRESLSASVLHPPGLGLFPGTPTRPHRCCWLSCSLSQ